MTIFETLLTNPLIISPLLGWFSAQFLKTCAVIFLQKTPLSFKDIIALLIWRTGGMPSSHAAFVSALTCTIGITEGTNTAIFALSLAFTIIVLRDSIGVRRSTGLQAHMINIIGQELHEHLQINNIHVKEVHGHNLIEVIVGIVIGFAMALAITII